MLYDIDWYETIKCLVALGAVGLISRIWAIAKYVKKNVMFLCSEMLPNHGTSLRDCLNRQEANISEVKESVEDLKMKNRILLDHYVDKAMFMSDLKGECIWVNKPYLKLLQVDTQEVLGNNWQGFIHNDDREKVLDEWESSVANKRNFEMVYNYRDKEDNKIRVNCLAIFSPKFGYIGFVTPAVVTN